MKVLRKKRKGGFTLIELIVVIAILGILAAIAIPRFTGTLNNSKLKADDATVRVIQSAVQVYKADNNGNNPANLAALDPNYLDTANLKWANNAAITAIVIDANGNVTGFTPAKPTY